jgi:hypothetical protein
MSGNGAPVEHVMQEFEPWAGIHYAQPSICGVAL